MLSEPVNVRFTACVRRLPKSRFDGSHVTAIAMMVPGTSYRPFAMAVAKGKNIRSVNAYNS
jgi:hypothetical protein